MEDGRTGDDPRSDQSDLTASDNEDSDLDNDAAAAASASVEEETDKVADDDPSIITHSRLIDGDGAIWKANGEMQEEVSHLSSYFIILHLSYLFFCCF
jgi:hypothetical protein